MARVWLLLFCFSYSHTSGVGNNSSNSSGAGISSGIPSSVPLQPSAPPQINVIAATPNIEKKQARVLYDYDAADSSELTLLADEVRHHLALILIWVACFGNQFSVDSLLIIYCRLLRQFNSLLLRFKANVSSKWFVQPILLVYICYLSFIYHLIYIIYYIHLFLYMIKYCIPPILC